MAMYMKKKVNKVTKMIYLASPFTYKSKGISMKVRFYREYLRYREVSKSAAILQHRYKVVIFPPITISYQFKELYPKKFGTTFKDWKDIDICAIDHCDEIWVLMMDGWKESVGVQAEIKHAKKNKIPIRYVSSKTLRLKLI